MHTHYYLFTFLKKQCWFPNLSIIYQKFFNLLIKIPIPINLLRIQYKIATSKAHKDKKNLKLYNFPSRPKYSWKFGSGTANWPRQKVKTAKLLPLGRPCLTWNIEI